MLTVFFRHWSVGAGVPVTATVNVAGEPTHAAWAVGWVPKEGVLTPRPARATLVPYAPLFGATQS